tara:strand:+ start:199 stop:546 length:348 start_codon:yes stop_codon:yes gene_type:complete
MNTEFKGTQGEWKVIDGWKLDKLGNEIKEKGTMFPSVLFLGNKEAFQKSMGRTGITINTSHNNSCESIMANAQLIAAAPIMLKALQDIYSDLSQGAIPNDIDFIKKAINKALGNE